MLVILIIFFFLAIPAYAKPKEAPDKPLTADGIVAKLKTQLELTDQQVDQIKPIIKNYIAKELQLKQEETRALRKVLTDEQIFTWTFLQNEKPRNKKKL